MLADDALKFRPIISLDVAETEDVEFMATVLVSLILAVDAMTDALVIATLRWIMSDASTATVDALTIVAVRLMLPEATAETVDALTIATERVMLKDATAETVDAAAKDADRLREAVPSSPSEAEASGENPSMVYSGLVEKVTEYEKFACTFISTSLVMCVAFYSSLKTQLCVSSSQV
jgi:hypothetical protein